MYLFCHRCNNFDFKLLKVLKSTERQLPISKHNSRLKTSLQPRKFTAIWLAQQTLLTSNSYSTLSRMSSLPTISEVVVSIKTFLKVDGPFCHKLFLPFLFILMWNSFYNKKSVGKMIIGANFLMHIAIFSIIVFYFYLFFCCTGVLGCMIS